MIKVGNQILKQGKKLKISAQNLFSILTLTLILVNCTSNKKITKTDINCANPEILCKKNKPIGKIFYDADTVFYSQKFKKIIISKADAFSVDSIVKSYVMSNSKTSPQILQFYEDYFRQFLAYKDELVYTRYVKIAFSRPFVPYQYLYWSLVDDGGDNFFYIKFNLDSRKVVEYDINH